MPASEAHPYPGMTSFNADNPQVIIFTHNVEVNVTATVIDALNSPDGTPPAQASIDACRATWDTAWPKVADDAIQTLN